MTTKKKNSCSATTSRPGLTETLKSSISEKQPMRRDHRCIFTRASVRWQGTVFSRTLKAEIKSQIVLGTSSTKLCLALQTDETLEKILTQGHTYVVTSRNLTEMETSATDQVNHLTCKKKSWKQRFTHTSKQQQTTTERKCFNCGGLRPREQGKFRPTRNKTCKACKNRGHFADICRGKS